MGIGIRPSLFSKVMTPPMLHKHRIVPGHMGGTYTPENVVMLTIEEHAEAHHQLYLKHGLQEDFLAWQGLSGQIGKEEIISKLLAIPGSRPKSEEHKRKIGLAIKGRKRPDLAARNKLGLTKGRSKSSEHRKKISQSMMGHVVSNETRKKISDARKERF